MIILVLEIWSVPDEKGSSDEIWLERHEYVQINCVESLPTLTCKRTDIPGNIVTPTLKYK